MSFFNKCLLSITETTMKFYSVTLGGFIFYYYDVLFFNHLKHNQTVKP